MKHITDTFKKFDALTAECGCFEDFDDLVNKRHPSYVPSLMVATKSKARYELDRDQKPVTNWIELLKISNSQLLMICTWS